MKIENSKTRNKKRQRKKVKKVKKEKKMYKFLKIPVNNDPHYPTACFNQEIFYRDVNNLTPVDKYDMRTNMYPLELNDLFNKLISMPEPSYKGDKWNNEEWLAWHRETLHYKGRITSVLNAVNRLKTDIEFHGSWISYAKNVFEWAYDNNQESLYNSSFALLFITKELPKWLNDIVNRRKIKMTEYHTHGNYPNHSYVHIPDLRMVSRYAIEVRDEIEREREQAIVKGQELKAKQDAIISNADVLDQNWFGDPKLSLVKEESVVPSQKHLHEIANVETDWEWPHTTNSKYVSSISKSIGPRKPIKDKERVEACHQAQDELLEYLEKDHNLPAGVTLSLTDLQNQIKETVQKAQDEFNLKVRRAKGEWSEEELTEFAKKYRWPWTGKINDYIMEKFQKFGIEPIEVPEELMVEYYNQFTPPGHYINTKDPMIINNQKVCWTESGLQQDDNLYDIDDIIAEETQRATEAHDIKVKEEKALAEEQERERQEKESIEKFKVIGEIRQLIRDKGYNFISEVSIKAEDFNISFNINK